MTVTKESLETMRLDWKRLQGQPKGLSILAQLHDCTKEEAAELLGVEIKEKKNPRTPRKHYPAATKRAILAAVLAKETTMESAAKAHGIPAATLRGWRYAATGHMDAGKRTAADDQ